MRMNFVHLTRFDGSHVYINLDMVSEIIPLPAGSKLIVPAATRDAERYVKVRERPEVVMSSINMTRRGPSTTGI